MPKLAKNYYYGKNGERKINCYVVNISKEIVANSNIKEDDEITVYSQGNKIIIEKK